MSQPPVQQSNAPSKAKSKYVNVYNSTVGTLDCNYFVPHEDPKLRSVRHRVKFMPGNNRISRVDLERCLKNKTFVQWSEEQTFATPTGHPYQARMIEVGKKVDHSEEESELERKVQKRRDEMEAYN